MQETQKIYRRTNSSATLLQFDRSINIAFQKERIALPLLYLIVVHAVVATFQAKASAQYSVIMN